MSECQHDWLVFSTALEDVVLMLQCQKCGAYGIVEQPTKEEWKAAFYAPSDPYPWHQGERVVLIHPEQSD